MMKNRAVEKMTKNNYAVVFLFTRRPSQKATRSPIITALKMSSVSYVFLYFDSVLLAAHGDD